MPRLRRFFLTSVEGAVGAQVALSEEVSHHAFDVLRLATGTRVALFDASGACVEALLANRGSAEIAARLEPPASAPALELAVPLLKGERQDWLVEKACELGVTQLLPLVCERAVIRTLSSGKRERYERLVVAACKQCGRNAPMRIAEPVPLVGLLGAGSVVLDPTAPLQLDDVVDTQARACLIVGPEGGFSNDERAAISASGTVRARLSQNVLRAETAALAAAAVAGTRLWI